MTSFGPDRAESIRHRLRNRLRERGDDVQLGLQRYARERFLYRLGESKHRRDFVLKGATLFALWGGALYRATRDLDFTGYGSPDQADVLAAFQEVCAFPSPADAIVFDPGTFSVEAIHDEGEYGGLRVRFEGHLGGSRIPIQIDVGFGDAIEPAVRDEAYPVLIQGPVPLIRAYPREAVVAENFHAMVTLGSANSQYKDFYDVHILATHFSFPGSVLARAIAATFERRRTPVTEKQPVAFTAAFYSDSKRGSEWQRYLSHNALPGASPDFNIVGEQIQMFLGPVWTSSRLKTSSCDILRRLSATAWAIGLVCASIRRHRSSRARRSAS